MGKSSIRNAIGLMSGTSMDGIDVALIRTDGEDHVERLGFESVAYDDAFRGRLGQALVDAATITMRTDRPGTLGTLERELTDRHAAAVAAFLGLRGARAADVDLVAFHGQTVLHRPDQGLTVQLGDGPGLARAIGIDVVYDLRAADVAAGGQGAPLAPIYHRVMARSLGLGAGQAPVAVLNIGGVANVTFVAAASDLLAFDTGPGNALIDDWVLARTGLRYDLDGWLAGAGRVDATLLATLLDDPYFAAPPPKSLDRNQFPIDALGGMSTEDGAATLAAFTVEAVRVAAELAGNAPSHWIVCGGGRHNRTIMRGLSERVAGTVLTAEAAGFNGDAIEAEAWAYLGVRALNGAAITFPGTTGVASATTGGVLARAKE